MLDLRRLARTPSTRAIALLVAPMAALLAGSCGPSGLPPSDLFVVQVTPAQATVQVGGTLTLTGNATGFTNYTHTEFHLWWIQEELDGPGTSNCATTSWVPPATLCPWGYLTYTVGDALPSSVTYHAPATPGRYHPMFRVILEGSGTWDSMVKDATATITVTP
jgi:hypothetical protein